MTIAMRDGAWARLGMLAGLGLLVAAACGDVSRQDGADDGDDGGDGGDGDGDGDGTRVDAGVEEGFSLVLAAERVLVRQGANATVEATIERAPGFDGPVTLTVGDLPGGVTAEAVTVGADDSEAVLSLSAAADSAQGASRIDVKAASGDITRARPLRLLVAGQPGTLDRSFASTGLFETQIGNMTTVGRGVVVQPGPSGDRLLVTGATATQAVTIRLDDTGALDDTFGSGGAVSTGVGPSSGGIVIRRATSGRILVGGWGGADSVGGYNSAIFAYTADGVLDGDFGQGGTAVRSLGQGLDEIHQVLEDEDGRLLLFSTYFDGPALVMTRFTAEGDPDPGFSAVLDGAFVETAILRDGRALVAGFYGLGLGANSLWITRRRADGSSDPDFDGDGHVMTDLGDTSNARVSGLIPLAAGKLLAIGAGNLDPEGRVIVLARYNPNGSLDLTFGNGGVIRTGTPFVTSAPNAAVADPEGRILFAGSLPGAATSVLAVARFLPDGALDFPFGEGGVATADFAAASIASDGAYGIALDSDGRIVLSGAIGPVGDQSLAVARFWP